VTARADGEHEDHDEPEHVRIERRKRSHMAIGKLRPDDERGDRERQPVVHFPVGEDGLHEAMDRRFQGKDDGHGRRNAGCERKIGHRDCTEEWRQDQRDLRGEPRIAGAFAGM